jgi:hypothetical protein
MSELDRWAGGVRADGAGYVRPLFKGEKRGHGCTSEELQRGETLIEVPKGEYPGEHKARFCTKEYWERKAAEAAEAELDQPITLRKAMELMAAR